MSLSANKNQYVKRIVLTAKHENPGGPNVSWHRDREYPSYYVSAGGRDFSAYDTDTSTYELTGISSRDWEITFEQDYREDFKKVASVVGKKKAAKVLEALKGAVPEDWED